VTTPRFYLTYSFTEILGRFGRERGIAMPNWKELDATTGGVPALGEVAV
jgi:hypothetical protein